MIITPTITARTMDFLSFDEAELDVAELIAGWGVADAGVLLATSIDGIILLGLKSKKNKIIFS